MDLVFVAMALLVGALMPTQAGINALLTKHWAGAAALAALVSFAVGTAALAAYCLAARAYPPGALAATRWWFWTGGFLGAVIVGFSVFLAPRLGAATLMALTVAGMMGASMVLDHFGWLGFTVRQAGLPRLAGAALIVAGVYLVRRF